MEDIAEQARSPAARRELGEKGVLPGLLLRLGDSLKDELQPSSLIPLLRALRNLCAGESLNQNDFVSKGGIDLVVSLVSMVVELQRELVISDEFAFSEEASSEWLDILKVVLQLLGNVATGDGLAREQIWKSFFPEIFLDIACICNEQVRDPLTMVLYTCCRRDTGWCMQISEGKGARLVAVLLRDSKNVSDNQWLGLLLEHLCFDEEHLPWLFNGMRPSTKGEDFSSEQALLLGALHSLFEDNPGLNPTMPSNSISFLVKTIAKAAENSRALPQGTSFPTGSPSCDVLAFSLLVSRELCANEGDDGSRRLADAFASFGLVQLCLEMLRALEPPEMIKKAMRKQQQEETVAAAQHELSKLALETSMFPEKDPYRGYRRDVVAVIANMAFRNPRVQDEVREKSGLLLVLQQCVVDENNPYLREWGLWAVRNLTEGNARNSEELAKLELQQAVDTEEMLRAGIKVEMDEKSGRPKLVNTRGECT